MSALKRIVNTIRGLKKHLGVFFAAFLGTSLAAWLARKPRLKEILQKVWIPLLVVAGVIVIGLVLWLVLPGATSWAAYFYSFSHFLGLLTSQGRLDVWLARAISVVLAGLVFFGVRMTAKKAHRTKGVILLLATEFAFNLLMYFCTRSVVAGDDGPYFVHATGEAKTWYSLTPTGDWELYDSPGVSRTGEDLQPMTPEAAREYETWSHRNDDRNRQQAAVRDRQHQAEVKRQFQETYLNSGVLATLAAPGPVAMLAWRTDPPGPQADAVQGNVLGLVAKKGIRAVAGLFKPAFYTTSAFDDLWNGDQSIVDRLGLLEKPSSSMLLASVKLSGASATEFAGLVSVQGTLSIIVVDKQGRRGPFVFSAAGSGADLATASATCAPAAGRGDRCRYGFSVIPGIFGYKFIGTRGGS